MFKTIHPKKQKMEFALQVNVFKEGKYYIAYSPALELSTQATDYSKVLERFNEIVEIFFEETSKEGNTQKALLQLGWSNKKGKLISPTPIATIVQNIQVTI